MPHTPGSARPSSPAAESPSRLQRRAGKGKRISFPYIEFLSSSRPSAACCDSRVNSPGDRSNSLLNRGSKKLQKREGMHKDPRSVINSPSLGNKPSFNVSTPLGSDAWIKTSPPKDTISPSPLQTYKDASNTKPTMGMDKREHRGCGFFIRKLFSCSTPNNSKSKKTSTTSASPVQRKKSFGGTGSNLKELQYYLGNESLRVCRELCRIQDDDDKTLHLLSPRVGFLPFNVRQFDTDEAPHTLLLPTTVFEDFANDEEQKIMHIFMENFIAMLPNGCDKISKKANPAGLVFRLLPAPVISSSARFLGAAFWLWLCAIDGMWMAIDGWLMECCILLTECVGWCCRSD
ncbi:hypothetical protein ABW19_dt0205174 [Dactylella cylindrospora]|nr:hypothetical protein ABW19_dt0205174 [Dactylella cylindrospora]